MNVKTLQEINTDFQAEITVFRRSVPSIISDLLFYLAFIVVLLYILTSGTNGGTPRTLGGYSWFTVVSRSMQDEIPKGSFILVKKTKDLAIGDNITFMRDSATSVTHKITAFYDNEDEHGSRGYQTQGLSNDYPDEAIVYDANIIGKVIYVLPEAGVLMTWLGANIHIVLLFYGLGVAFSFCIRGLFDKPSVKGRRPTKNLK